MHRQGGYGALALAAFVAAVVVFGALLDGYSHAVHPVALLGAGGGRDALAFNLLGFVLPGALAACAAWRLRADIGGMRWLARIGAQLALVSALAFAAQGLLPLDPTDLDGGASRLHATAWTVWWIAFVAGASLFAAGARRAHPWRAAGSALAAIVVLVLAASPWQAWPPAIGQRAAFVAWLGWIASVPMRGRVG